MRVTASTFIRNAQISIQQRQQQIAELQNQISTGTRIHRPSDDPLGFRTLESLNLFDNELSDRLSTVADMESTLNQSVSSLVEFNTLIQDARRIVVDARSAGDADERALYADQIDGILNRMVQLANTRDDHGYLFSGMSDQTEPFSVHADGTISYAGSDRDSVVSVVSQLDMPFRYSGANVFFLPERGETRIAGHDELALGDAATSGTSRAEIAVAHVATSYAGGSGVQPGTDSAGGDTIIGAAGTHTLTIRDTSGNGSAGVVSLNGGAEFSFSSADTNLQIVGANGESVFLDMSAISAGFDGTVDITATGELQFSDGSDPVAIDFTDAQSITDASGNVTVFDTTNVTHTGSSTVEYDSTQDVFSTLTQIRDSLKADWDPADLPALDSQLEFHHEDLQRLSDHVLRVVGDQSTSLESLELIRFRTENSQLETQRLLGEVNNVDMSQAIVELQNEQNFYQYTLATLPGILDLSLLNYLQ